MIEIVCCEECNGRAAKTNIIVNPINGKKICRNCATKIYRCPRCNSFYKQTVFDINVGGWEYTENSVYDRYFKKVICNKCRHELNLCNSCHGYYTEDDICVFCVENAIVHGYHYKPTPIFHQENIDDNLFAGIELEINFNDKKNFKKFLTASRDFDFVYCKHDGSLHSYGVEIVSHPANFQYHFHNNWKNIFNYFQHCTNTDGCGLHVHLNKNYFRNNGGNAYTLDYIVNNCNKVICDIGSRKLDNYCRKNVKYSYGLNSSSAHTSACNMSNDNTVELRFCKSTNNYNSFLRKLKMIYTLVKFADKYNEDSVKQIDIAKEFDKFKGDYLSTL